MAVGIIAAQSIGEPGTQLTMRTFHIGGTVNTSVEESETKAKKGGIVQFTRMRVVKTDEGKDIVLTRNGEISLLDPKGREIEKYEVPTGATLLVQENQEVKAGSVLCQWNPHTIPILAEVTGKVRFEDVVEGETMRLERDPSGHVRKLIIDHKGELHPQIVLEDADGKPLDVYYLPERAHIVVDEGETDRPPARCSPRRRAKPPASRTSPAVCPASPKSSRPASPRTRPSSPKSTAWWKSSAKNAAASGRSSSAARAASNANTSSPTANGSWFTRATS